MVSPPSFHSTPHDQPIHQIVTPLFAIREGREEYVNGSAFLIGRGWAVTAYHVLEDYLRQFGVPYSGTGEVAPSFEILGYFALEGGKTLLPVRMMRAWRAEPLDLAVLAFGVPEDWRDDHVWKVPAIDLFPPKVGTEVAAVGFPNSRFAERGTSEGLSLTVDPKTSTGRVLELHHTIRDSARLRFPCFRTDARFDGGMSGGPVINNTNGHICGVVCSGMDGTSSEDGYISYASSLWPIIGTKVDAEGESVSGAVPYPLYDLFKRKVFDANGLEAVHVTEDPSGNLVPSINYNATEWDGAQSA